MKYFLTQKYVSGFSGASFLGSLPGSDKVLVIYPNCDCDIEVEDVIDLLSRVSLIK